MSSGDAHSTNTSGRRILSRSKASTTDERHQSSSSSQVESSQKSNRSTGNPIKQESKEQQADTSFTSSQQQQSILNSQIVNYLNKESFNEDVEPEESSLYSEDMTWRTMVIEKLKNLIEDLKKLQSNPIENVGKIKRKYFSKNKVLFLFFI